MKKNLDSLELRTIKKVRNHLIPYLILLYLIAFIDRQNIGFAALEMNKDLALTSEQFGIISGIFFIGYFLFEVPSNILLQKFGARKWIARILLSWGIIATLTGFVQNETQLYILRFLLGIAEAGFFPGIILYLTYWFRNGERARMIALFMVAIPLSSFISSPISGMILDYVGWFGINGWRWMFILEGLPAIVFGMITFFVLIDRPDNAKWLTDQEKTWLNGELHREHQEKISKHSLSMKQVALNPRVWQLTIVCLCANVGVYGMGIWVPQIISGLFSNFSSTEVGFLTMIPFGVGVIIMVLNGKHSDRFSERRYHAALGPLLSGVSLIIITLTTNSVFQ